MRRGYGTTVVDKQNRVMQYWDIHDKQNIRDNQDIRDI